MCVCVCLKDLVELMMMQNAQMHQVIMNNMTMSALSSFGYMQAPEVNKLLMNVSNSGLLFFFVNYACKSCLA